ncbi:MAG: glycosyltransferase family 39 protein [Verrucomicrobia bacterium]|nr:glycosyltransferase family 39 protein [Verrucomicrobiota bacterium]
MDTKPLDTPAPTPEPLWRRLLPPRRLFLLILCLGALVRFYGLNWDQSTGQHPDERHVMMSTGRLEWPKSLAEYFDEAASPLNPRNRGAHFFAYGTLPSTLLRAFAELGGATRPEQIGNAARGFAAVFDLGTLILVYALGRTLYRRSGVALLGAFLYAFAVLPIQHARFFVVDPFANFFVALALLFLARAWRSGAWYEYAGTGVALGLGIACKISVATFGLPVALVALLPSAVGTDAGSWQRRLLRAVGRTAFFVLVTVVTVRLALPDAFAGFWPWQIAPRWLANMREVIGISTGVTDIVFTRQFYGRTPLLWPWWNMVVWGLGVPLGLTAWAGWAVAGWRLARWREAVHFIPFCWVATVFFHQGFTYQATLRYFLPAYGCLCLLAGWLLAEFGRWGWEGLGQLRQAWRRPQRLAALATPIVVAGLTVAWALGFLSIYSQPHTRVEASKWIYENIPRGAVLACEHWDDWLPLPLPGTPGPGVYKQIEFPHYVADNPEKRGDLLAKLNQTDYIILASQKLRDSIPRGPHRYPFTIDYYNGLEDGSLGFDLVASFKRPIRFLGWRIWDRQAEEAFSVYDHPPVYIYKKSARFDPEKLVRRFNAIPLDGVTDTREPQKPQPRIVRRGQRLEPAGQPESAILLPPERWAAAQREGTWSQMFDRQSFSARYPVVAWIGLLLVLQAIGWSLLGGLLRRLPDRGAALARPFGLLLPAWALWWLASRGWARNNATTWWLLLLALALLGGLLAWRSRADWIEWWRDHRGSFLRVEGCFWVAFFAFLLVRLGNPDLWHPAWGGEKPMEMTFMYGVLRSEEFPPLNPWFAGGFINYYYFGFVLCGVMIKGLGVLPEYGFNLCLATFFGLGCAATLSAARALRPRASWLPAWTATGFVMVLGNLFQIRFIWNRLVALGLPDHDLRFPVVSDVIRAICGVKRLWNGEHLSPYLADLYWVAARAIGVSGPNEVPPITEFPYWSFLYADLHPHLIALPFTLCVIALLAAWVQSSGFLVKCGLSGLLALTLGFFWPTNTWDWPTYGALTGLVLFLTSWRRESPTPTWAGFGWAMARSVGLFLVLLFCGWLLFRPYHQNYVAGYGSFERWTGDRTSLRDYLFIYGLPLFVLLTAVIVALRRGELPFARGLQLWVGVARSFLRGGPPRRRARLLRLGLARRLSFAGLALSLILLALAAATVLRSQLNALLLAGIALSIVWVWERRSQPLQAVPALLTLIAFGLSLLVEVVVLVGDIGRMNTVFKFYYQVWVCFGLAAALALPEVLDAVGTWRPRPHRLWMSSLCALIFAASLYPALGTPTKIRDRFAVTPPTLDGLAFADKAQYFLKEKHFPLRPDLLAIRWLQDHVQGSPVLLEMNTGTLLYTWGSRYAVHTGLPTPAGWSWHQRQQQAGLANNRVDERIAEVQLIYRTPDAGLARRLLDKFEVQYLVVGELERLFGTPEGIAKFEQMGLEKVYDAEGVQIYRVRRGNTR